MRRLPLLAAALCALGMAACNSTAPRAQTPPPPLPQPEAHDVTAFLQTLPAAENPPWSEMQAMTLAAYPLACIDHLQAQGGGAPDTAAAAAATSPAGRAEGRGHGGRGNGPGGAETEASPAGTGAAASSTAEAAGRGETPPAAGRGAYLWQPAGPTHLLEGYDRQRAFYGCYDWHSAVNSTWTMVAILRRYPNLPLAKLMREKLNDHLGKRNLAGELAFFEGSRSYERPYGQAWAMKLYNEIATWNDPDAQAWAANMKPLATLFASGMVSYLNDLPDAIRQGVHPNTANAMHLMLPYAATTHDAALHAAIVNNARRLFLGDEDCPTGYEPDGSSFLSPCLSEAYLMSEVLDRGEFVAWFDHFMPPVYTRAFRPLVQPFDASLLRNPDQLAAKSHLVGLAFARADAFLAIAAALPPGDPRVPVYRRLAAIHATQGYAGLESAGYLGSHWMASYALMYQLSGTQGSGNAPPAVAATASASGQ